MKREEVHVGRFYRMKVSNVVTIVKLGPAKTSPHAKGWTAVNIFTGREVNVRTAAKLRKEARCTHCPACVTLKALRVEAQHALAQASGDEEKNTIKARFKVDVDVNRCIGTVVEFKRLVESRRADQSK